MSTYKFETVYKKIKVSNALVKPTSTYPRMEGWSVDRYEVGGYFAVVTDAGYCRRVGQMGEDRKTLWQVIDNYPERLDYRGITEEEFEKVEIQPVKDK